MTTRLERAPGSLPEHLRAMLEGYLRALDFAAGDPTEAAEAAGIEGLVDAMRYSLLAGGKRIRGVLALACCEALGGDPERLLPTAAAIELVHTYSLIHDDLPAMDDDDLRRGQPTCHRVYGEDVAILAGDALFAEAVRLVCERQTGGAEVQVKILAELSRASGVNGMVGGQFLDLRGAGHTSADALRRVHALKTGRLIACAIHCAVVLADPAPEVELAYRAFARELGLLFQIVRRHPRRGRLDRDHGQGGRIGRAQGQGDLREPARPRARAGARGRDARPDDRAPGVDSRPGGGSAGRGGPDPCPPELTGPG